MYGVCSSTWPARNSPVVYHLPVLRKNLNIFSNNYSAVLHARYPKVHVSQIWNHVQTSPCCWEENDLLSDTCSRVHTMPAFEASYMHFHSHQMFCCALDNSALALEPMSCSLILSLNCYLPSLILNTVSHDCYVCLPVPSRLLCSRFADPIKWLSDSL